VRGGGFVKHVSLLDIA